MFSSTYICVPQYAGGGLRCLVDEFEGFGGALFVFCVVVEALLGTVRVLVAAYAFRTKELIKHRVKILTFFLLTL